MSRITQIVQLGPALFGVYLAGLPLGEHTPLLFRGTFEECQKFRQEYVTGEAA